MAIDTLLRMRLSMTNVTVCKTLQAMAFMLAVIMLAASTTAAMLPTGPMVTSGVGSTEHQKGGSKTSGTSNAELYKNMVLAEQELGESYDDDYNDNDDNDVKDNKDSLLSMITSRSNGSTPESSGHLLMCVSCTGVLPMGYDERDAYANEQSYCLPDLPTSQKKNYNEENDEDKEKSICFGASRCWKAKVREVDGRVRISRGCVTGGQGSNRYSSQNGAQLLHPCLGALHVETVSKNSDNSQQSQYTVWTSAHIYSSANADRLHQSPTPPPRYVIECCAGLDKCNDGPFPPLPSDRLGDDDLQLAWWRRSSISLAVLLLVVVIVVAAVIVVLFKNDGKRRKRKSRRKSKKRKRSHHLEDGYCSDDSDKKKRRHLSFSSMSLSSSSSSLSSVSSSSCCEGKTGKRKKRRKQHVTALTMVDLLKGVVVTGDATANDDDTYGSDSNRKSYTEYSPAALTESTIDDDFLPPPYKRRNDDHQNNRPEDDLTSGSGYGMPVLVQRTLAKQIQLRQLVGKGRYGEVWRATYWNGGHEHVAVKIFLSKDEPSWKRETEIYSTVLIRHDNILGFIGSDIMTSRNSYTTQLLLITHYHRYGSLYDFLQTADMTCNGGYNIGVIDAADGQPQQNVRDRPPLTVIQMLNVLYTIASGLNHLHTEIHGTQGKPGIAHRDVKSKNVLVKCAQTGTCCVADFGMAVTSRDATLPSQTTIAAGAGNNQNTRVGTKRYMAPEVLDDSISSTAAMALASTPTTTPSTSVVTNSSSAYWCFDAYRRGDVYSYALVMWEVLSRTLIPPDHANDPDEEPQQQQPLDINQYNPCVYRAPYQDRGVGWDPGFDDMRNVVCSPDPVLSRPGVATEWQANSIVNKVVRTMRECWHANPNARLPTLRVKKTLAELKENTTAETKLRPNSEQLTTITD